MHTTSVSSVTRLILVGRRGAISKPGRRTASTLKSWCAGAAATWARPRCARNTGPTTLSTSVATAAQSQSSSASGQHTSATLATTTSSVWLTFLRRTSLSVPSPLRCGIVMADMQQDQDRHAKDTHAKERFRTWTFVDYWCAGGRSRLGRVPAAREAPGYRRGVRSRLRSL